MRRSRARPTEPLEGRCSTRFGRARPLVCKVWRRGSFATQQKRRAALQGYGAAFSPRVTLARTRKPVASASATTTQYNAGL